MSKWKMPAAAAIGFSILTVNFALARQTENWVSTWAAAPVFAYPNTEFGGLTTREIMHATVGGTQVRLRISNFYGTVPLVIGALHIAVAISDIPSIRTPTPLSPLAVPRPSQFRLVQSQ
jgi:hypothetical protein